MKFGLADTDGEEIPDTGAVDGLTGADEGFASVTGANEGFTYSADGANDAGSLTGAEDGHVLHTVEYSPELQY